MDTLRSELEAAQMEGIRYKELSEISSLQAQSIGSFKQQHMDELTSLRCVRSRVTEDISQRINIFLRHADSLLLDTMYA